MSIFTHVVVGTNDLERARAFYDAVLQTVGVKRVMNLTRHPSGVARGPSSW